MSNDQLGWAQILTDEPKPALSPGAPLGERPVVANEAGREKAKADGAEAAPPAKKTSRSKKVKSSSSTSTEEETLFAKKDWGKLELPKAPEKPAAPAAAPAPPAPTVRVSEAPAAAPTPVAQEPEPAAGDEAKESDEPQVLSVSDLNRHIREILEGRFPLLWLKGEISNFKAHTSGHFYFSLKDAKAQINAVMFRGFNSQLRFRPEDGMEVLVRGKVTVYEPRGNYQIFCEVMEPVGAGALQKAFEQLKAKLQKEGLFDEARKRPLPALPRHIAIVTSPTGAAIRDMLNVLGRRFKGARITLVPCKVQGDQAPREICAAIALANRLADVDVMIVGRGGGSIEDLWAFNDEGVARAIAGSRVPVISAVGHEVDFTIADFVADLRAPTPSAAAELVVKNAADLQQRVVSLTRALRLAMARRLELARQACAALAKRLVDPQRRIQDAVMRCDELLQRLQVDVDRVIEQRRMRLGPCEQRLRAGERNVLVRKRERLDLHMAVLDSLSPLRVLERGFSVVMKNGRIVGDAASLRDGDELRVRMGRGSIDARVTKINPPEK